MSFILPMKSLNSSSVPVHIMKMSSIKRFQICMFLLFCLTSSVSSVPINRFAYEGAILVPMAVPGPCSDTFLTVPIPTFLYIFHEMFFITCLCAFFLLLYTTKLREVLGVQHQFFKTGQIFAQGVFSPS